jgi:uncharacterized protein
VEQVKEHYWVRSRDKRLSVMVHFPKEYTDTTPLVVCCHGFTGNKVGYNHITMNLANRLEHEGYSVVRFDYAGSGDSDGDFAADTCVAGWKEDLENILTWVKEQPNFRAAPKVLYGHSLGGLVVLTRKDAEKDIFARAVFAPTIHAVDNFRDIIFGSELWNQACKGETIRNFQGKGFALEHQFVDDLLAQRYNPLEDASKLTTPLLIIHGSKDTAVPIEGSRKLFAEYNGQKALIILDADHIATGRQNDLQTAIVQWMQKLFS